MIPVVWRRVAVVIAVAVCCAPAVAGSVVDFEDLAVGTTFGALDGHTDGELVYTQNGIDVHVEDFFFESTPIPGYAEVGGTYDADFASTPLSIDNLSLRFEFAGVGFDVSEVTFGYAEFGGLNNFAVNDGGLIQLSPLTTLPTDVAPGVTATVDGGLVTLVGDIDSFLVGGQELGIDNIVATPEPGALTLLAACGLGVLRRIRRTKS